MQDHFSEEQYIVVKCNIDQDLYEVRPALGGPTKWLNRKMLILDPRGDQIKSGEPLEICSILVVCIQTLMLPARVTRMRNW